MAKHTPGPWTAEFPAVLAGGGTICDVRNWGTHNTNEHLIAAAPELLAACEAALVRENERDTEALSALRGQLRAAIAKATGKEE